MTSRYVEWVRLTAQQAFSGTHRPCFKCKTAVDAKEFFCHGCRAYVCTDCDKTEFLFYGPHKPADHLR